MDAVVLRRPSAGVVLEHRAKTGHRGGLCRFRALAFVAGKDQQSGGTYTLCRSAGDAPQIVGSGFDGVEDIVRDGRAVCGSRCRQLLDGQQADLLQTEVLV